ncbi:hypothetical protein CE91St63_11290 [[Clostridium] hylemonae]|nr:hypothetical protein CE91St63_11290 [[Clostridium] hylemonae]
MAARIPEGYAQRFFVFLLLSVAAIRTGDLGGGSSAPACRALTPAQQEQRTQP